VADRRAGLTRPDRAPSTRRQVVRRLLTAVIVVLVLTVAASVSGLVPLQTLRVESGSMTPTFGPGDLVLVERDPGPVQRRDIVVVRDPQGGEQLVKRVVAVGGDRLRLEDGVLVVDDEPVCEPTIDPDRIDGVFFRTVTVPAGELFLLGDDRRDSVDSRDFGTVAESEVLGLVRARVWPSPGGLSEEPC
jgi:signal peptidase I